MLYEEIQKDIKDAMIGGLTTKRDCLRTIISEIKNQTINAGKPITEEICLKVIQKSVKQHNDSIENFKIGNREDLALKEMEELKYLEIYLPKRASEEDTRKCIDTLISSGAISPEKKNFGRFMKALDQNIDKKIASKYLNLILK